MVQLGIQGIFGTGVKPKGEYISEYIAMRNIRIDMTVYIVYVPQVP